MWDEGKRSGIEYVIEILEWGNECCEVEWGELSGYSWRWIGCDGVGCVNSE